MQQPLSYTKLKFGSGCRILVLKKIAGIKSQCNFILALCVIVRALCCRFCIKYISFSTPNAQILWCNYILWLFIACILAYVTWLHGFLITEMVPNDVQSELKHLYVALGELLRHFWSCFPVNTPFLEEKVVWFPVCLYELW